MFFGKDCLKWWMYDQIEDLHAECAKKLRKLEEKEIKNGHGWQTPKENLPSGWFSIAFNSLDEYSKSALDKKEHKKQNSILGLYQCTWESQEHEAIRNRYKRKITKRRLSLIPQAIFVLGGISAILSFVMQCRS